MVRRRYFVGIAAIAAVLALSPASAAAPERNQVIRMGMGIGKVHRGMTLPAVRRALGGPHRVVYRRHNFGARGRYIELGWELPGRTSWEPNIWQVGFRSLTRRGPLRVVRVATTAPAQRTPRNLGVGSRSEAVARAYPDATCVLRYPSTMPHPGTFIVVSGPRGMTAFEVTDKTHGARPTDYFVVAVMVQGTWFSKGRGHESCPSGWENW